MAVDHILSPWTQPGSRTTCACAVDRECGQRWSTTDATRLLRIVMTRSRSEILPVIGSEPLTATLEGDLALIPRNLGLRDLPVALICVLSRTDILTNHTISNHWLALQINIKPF